MAADWHTAGSADEISDDQPLAVTIGEKEIGVYCLNGQYYALEDVCPHAHAYLTQGFVMGEEIECPLHGARFHIPTGKCTQEPGGRDLDTYPVKVEDGKILVRVKT